jgi:hypothetical protein
MRGHVPKKPPAQFTTFQLHTNFRSLSGIVQFAGSMVQTIYDLFPDSIDVMKPETAKHDGPSPIVFDDIQDEGGFFEQFLLGSKYVVSVFPNPSGPLILYKALPVVLSLGPNKLF